MHIVYSAIGAVDFYINMDAHFRNPESLTIPDLFLLAGGVRVLEDCTHWQMSSEQTCEQHLRTHFQNELEVNTDANPLFQVTGESIAIDIC